MMVAICGLLVVPAVSDIDSSIVKWKRIPRKMSNEYRGLRTSKLVIRSSLRVQLYPLMLEHVQGYLHLWSRPPCGQCHSMILPHGAAHKHTRTRAVIRCHFLFSYNSLGSLPDRSTSQNRSKLSPLAKFSTENHSTHSFRIGFSLWAIVVLD